jgi:hypothetical protein
MASLGAGDGRGGDVIFSIILAIVLVLGALAYVAAPLFRERMRAGRRGPEEERIAALLEKESAFQLLTDLEHDRGTGKLDPEDYSAQKEVAQARAIDALKRLDALGVQAAPGMDPIEHWIREERRRLEKEAGR